MEKRTVRNLNTAGEAIIGWRVWVVLSEISPDGSSWVNGEYGLLSPLIHTIWPCRARFEAEPKCYLYDPDGTGEGEHMSPNEHCVCGIYAVKDELTASKYLRNELSVTRSWREKIASEGGIFRFAIGKVSLWGNVIEHENGYRAQYAYPYEVILIDGDENIAGSLRRQYQVDVKLCTGPA